MLISVPGTYDLRQNNEAHEWRHVSDKQTSRLFLQTHKPSVFQNHVFKTKTWPTFPPFLSEHACVLWTSSGSSNLHSIFRLRAFCYRAYALTWPICLATHGNHFRRPYWCSTLDRCVRSEDNFNRYFLAPATHRFKKYFLLLSWCLAWSWDVEIRREKLSEIRRQGFSEFFVCHNELAARRFHRRANFYSYSTMDFRDKQRRPHGGKTISTPLDWMSFSKQIVW